MEGPLAKRRHMSKESAWEQQVSRHHCPLHVVDVTRFFSPTQDNDRSNSRRPFSVEGRACLSRPVYNQGTKNCSSECNSI